MKYILPAVLIVILLSFSANAIDEPCINNDDCDSNICEGGYCRELSIAPYISDLLSDLLDELIPVTDDSTPPPSGNGGGNGGGGGGSGGGTEWRGSSGICISNWTCTGWTACINNKKTRTCTDINDCQEEIVYGKPSEEMLCQLTVYPTCSDGILNQDEEDVDCGGPCQPCASCYDQEQNCHQGLCEDDIDCGGPCIPCKHVVPMMLIIIAAFIILLLLVLGFWYWKLRKSAEDIGDKLTEQEFFRLK